MIRRRFFHALKALLKNMRQENKTLMILATAILLSGIGYSAYQNSLLTDEIVSIKKEFADKKIELESLISDLQKDLETTKIERDGWEERYNTEVSKIAFLAAQVESIKGTVGILIDSTRRIQSFSKNIQRSIF